MGTDYTACEGNDCPIKEKCKRFTGTKEPLYQSWFTEIPGKWEEFDSNKLRSDTHPNDPDYPKPIMSKMFSCEMFWGEAQDSIMNQLNEIMK